MSCNWPGKGRYAAREFLAKDACDIDGGLSCRIPPQVWPGNECRFSHQMLAARNTGEWLETLLIWKYALRDVITVGLPLRLTDSLTMAAILSAARSSRF